MRIACPSCAATYEVPDRLLSGAPRSLRCSRCGADFTPPRAEASLAPSIEPPAEQMVEAMVPTPAAAPEPAATPAPAPPPVPARAPVAAPPTTLLRAWVGSLALVLGSILALVLFRTQVMSAWPPATRLFAALGLA